MKPHLRSSLVPQMRFFISKKKEHIRLFGESYPIDVEKRCVVFLSRTHTIKASLRSNPLSLYDVKGLTKFRVLLPVCAVGELSMCLDAIADSGAPYFCAYIYIRCSCPWLRYVIDSIFLSVGARHRRQCNRLLFHRLFCFAFLCAFADYVTKDTAFRCAHKFYCRIVLPHDDETTLLAFGLEIRIGYKPHAGHYGEVLCRQLLQQHILQIADIMEIFRLLRAIEAQTRVAGIAIIPVVAPWSLKLPLQSQLVTVKLIILCRL